MSSRLALIACMVRLRLLLITPWNWKAWRVVEPQRAVGVVGRDPVERQPLRRRADAARHAHPHHEAVGLLELLLAPLRAQVAIVLLVGAVELGELGIVLADRAGDRLAEASAIVPRR